MKGLTTSRRNFAASVLVGLALPFASAATASDDYPNRPIELILPAAPGGTTDLAVRLMAERWRETLGQPVLVVNRPGAGGALGANIVAGSAPDGYTLMGAFDSLIVALPLVQDVTYTIDSFDYLNGFGIGAIYFMVRADSPWNTIEEFLTDAAARPGELTYASYGVGVITHFTAERLFQLADAELEYVTFQSSPEAATAVMGGHVDLAVTAGTGGVGNDDRIRLLAVAGDERRPDFPNVPTLKEQGYDVSLDFISAVLAPAGLPEAVRAKLEQTFSDASEAYAEEFQAGLVAGGLLHVNMTGQQVRDAWSERADWFSEVLPRVQQ